MPAKSDSLVDGVRASTVLKLYPKPSEVVALIANLPALADSLSENIEVVEIIFDQGTGVFPVEFLKAIAALPESDRPAKPQSSSES